jgi:glycosyltransferase involved in cell wall biosynthesis
MDVFVERVHAAGGVVLPGPRGLTAQRNVILSAVKSDILLFIDDDFFLAPDYLAELERVYQERADVVLVTGHVVADGILGPGLSVEEAMAAVASAPPGERRLSPVHNGYGCNMSFRMAPVRAHGITFDERLPFYGWLEDLDHGRRLAAHGALVQSHACRGAHMGVKRGRQSGLKLGYSQIANPAYLAAKGTMAHWRAARIMGRNMIANTIKSLAPEPWVDRRGRLKGNLVGLADLIRGRANPERIRDL